MNRIRKYKNNYQVLITPHQKINVNFEFMLGGWTDPNLRNYEVREFKSLEDAHRLSLSMPDLPWDKLVLAHKDVYGKLHKIIKQIISKSDIVLDFESILMTSDMVKNVMFDRVMMNGNRFSLDGYMNDIINFNLINPWSHNLKDIAEILTDHPELNIYKSHEKHGVIHLIGKTDIGTTYEIVLWPTMIAHWAKWALAKNPSRTQREETLRETLKIQQYLDLGYSIQ